MTITLWNPLKKLPTLVWLKTYNKSTLHADAMAAIIVTIMLIPQSLAYAMLAGLPPATGLYASILPLLAYALLGSSRTLAVGPAAIIFLLSANVVGLANITSGLDVLTLSIALALLSGILMLIIGSEHFRNIERHDVEQCDQVIALRIDESLFFGNVRDLDNQLNLLLAQNPCLEHLIVMGSGIII